MGPSSFAGGPALPPEMNPEDAAALAMILQQGAGGPGMAPPPGMPTGPDPAAVSGLPGSGLPPMPLPGAAAPIPGMPSTDPAAYQALQAQDHAALAMAQQAAQQQAQMMPMQPDPSMGGQVAGILPGMPPIPEAAPLPGSVAGAWGGEGMGSLESGDVAPLPGDGFGGGF